MRLMQLLSWGLWKVESQLALDRLTDTAKNYPADAHETYFEANGENYRIRIERIPSGKKEKE